VNGPNQRVDKAAARLWAAAFVVELNPGLERGICDYSVGAALPVLERWCRRTRASAEAVQPSRRSIPRGETACGTPRTAVTRASCN